MTELHFWRLHQLSHLSFQNRLKSCLWLHSSVQARSQHPWDMRWPQQFIAPSGMHQERLFTDSLTGWKCSLKLKGKDGNFSKRSEESAWDSNEWEKLLWASVRGVKVKGKNSEWSLSCDIKVCALNWVWDGKSDKEIRGVEKWRWCKGRESVCLRQSSTIVKSSSSKSSLYLIIR